MGVETIIPGVIIAPEEESSWCQSNLNKLEDMAEEFSMPESEISTQTDADVILRCLTRLIRTSHDPRLTEMRDAYTALAFYYLNDDERLKIVNRNSKLAGDKLAVTLDDEQMQLLQAIWNRTVQPSFVLEQNVFTLPHQKLFINEHMPRVETILAKLKEIEESEDRAFSLYEMLVVEKLSLPEEISLLYKVCRQNPQDIDLLDNLSWINENQTNRSSGDRAGIDEVISQVRSRINNYLPGSDWKIYNQACLDNSH